MIRERIKDIRHVKASDLMPNPRNWRRHPKYQRDAMRAILDEVGNVDVLKVVETPEGLLLIDGHLRADLMPNETVQVAVLDLDEDEQVKMLVTFDPIAAMAETDTEAFTALAEGLTTDSDALTGLLESVASQHTSIKDGVLWAPEEDTTTGEHAQDAVGYDLGSVWMREGDADSRVFDYLQPLPVNPRKNKKGALTANYSRSPAREMEWIVRTYMRSGDYFLEVCAGWWTFSTAAALYGYSGEGVDIWPTSLNFGRRQLGVLPTEAGTVKVVEGDALQLPYPGDRFDFVYCNPPFWQLERYGNDPRDLSEATTVEAWLSRSGDMMAEMLRVAKPGALIVTIMADAREDGVLIPLHAMWLDEAKRRGLPLHDLVVQHLLSQQLRFWRHAYDAKRTAKAHEYVIVFKKP